MTAGQESGEGQKGPYLWHFVRGPVRLMAGGTGPRDCGTFSFCVPLVLSTSAVIDRGDRRVMAKADSLETSSNVLFWMEAISPSI